MVIGSCIDELGVDTNPVIRFLDRTFQYVTYAQFLSDLLDVYRFVLVNKNRSTGDYQ